jgi:hypothetical protein
MHVCQRRPRVQTSLLVHVASNNTQRPEAIARVRDQVALLRSDLAACETAMSTRETALDDPYARLEKCADLTGDTVRCAA